MNSPDLKLKTLGDIIFPDLKYTVDDIEKKYPERNLPKGACVTRIAPSPTGFLHLGNLYGALIDERLAHQSGGVFILRIEDTDQKREVEGALEKIYKIFSDFNLKFDEGMGDDGESGQYGPYTQSDREIIYKVYIRHLIEKGRAYPCFCSDEECDKIKKKQKAVGENTGYYGKWAKCRNISTDEAIQKITAGEKYIIRFKSLGDESKRIAVNDLIKGLLDPPENIRDEVIMKSDNLPTYHFAHVVDDHLMKTTHVVRGEEWLATLPIHIEIFSAFEWQHPHYMHTAHFLKQEDNVKRKLSKRKDPELALDFYSEKGYIADSVLEYVMTILNSNYEEWRIKNPYADRSEFKFSIEKLSPSGALFDLAKLDDISRNYIAKLTAEKLYELTLDWAKKYDSQFYEVIKDNSEYALKILSIGRGGDKPRKDLTYLSEVRGYISFFFDTLFAPDYTMPENINPADVKLILQDYIDIYNESDDQIIWFDKIKELSQKYGYASETKLYKKNPSEYKGHVGDVSMMIRVAVCGRINSPDMYSVLRIMGKELVIDRLRKYLNK